MDKETVRRFKLLGYLSTVGLAMGLSVGIGALVGHYLDEKFQTRGWLLFIFIGLGIVAAFRNLYFMYKKVKDL
jgi:F0F1-type ATP synthase assembly protein I